jgi:hypothetical protein
MRALSFWTAVAAAAWLAPSLVAAQGIDASFPQAQGSYQPPLAWVGNETTYVNGTGILVLVGPFTFGGGAVGFGWGFGDAPRPEHGFEANVAAITGGGTLDGPDLIPPEYGFDDVHLSLTTAAGSFIYKYRPFDPGDNGRFGLTLYGGGMAGMLQLAVRNVHGTARRNFFSTGATLGGVGQLVIVDWLEIEVYAGGRYLIAAAAEEEGDPVAPPTLSHLSPEFGGNVFFHLPFGIDLSLGSVLNFMKRDDEDNDLAKIFVVGVGWRLDPAPGNATEGTP